MTRLWRKTGVYVGLLTTAALTFGNLLHFWLTPHHYCRVHGAVVHGPFDAHAPEPNAPSDGPAQPHADACPVVVLLKAPGTAFVPVPAPFSQPDLAWVALIAPPDARTPYPGLPALARAPKTSPPASQPGWV